MARLCILPLLLVCARAAVLTTQSSVTALRSAARRDILRVLGLGVSVGAQPARSFENAIPEYADYVDKAKRRGTPPKDLGIAQRTINADSIQSDPVTFAGLRGCDGKPNCFSTTGDDLLEDRILTGVDTLIPPWKPPAGDAAPFQSLVNAVKAYRPGQGYVDGGGFQIVKETDSYLYVQFEALKKGYIDDVEFAMGKGGTIMVRSSSRVGQTDFGVNAKRLNYIAATLRDQGWTIVEITPKTHADYFYAADDARDQTFDKDRRKGTDMENARMERPTVG
eukprot:CAMPEP_0174728332 /NCGR_PEP_ID=MMETSP1094-20130205/51514_1 /TAXON_ID=156173 /ORGANISM="Chrysochromulina brevifilum, Strain UTEX LB 985" /LENGTH=278 /DNA_ID=CAMNT_0015930225 /DNA_START=15 /DNA_END=851 /DNA_ORIENTATION=-